MVTADPLPLYSQRITPQEVTDEGAVRCPFPRWIRGECDDHGSKRWLTVGCKARDCASCGSAGRRRIAERLAWGCRTFMERGIRVGWLVLTYRRDTSKNEAVRDLGAFIRRLRKRHGRFEYAATYELTKAGRLHINLLIPGWTYIRKRTLDRLWGQGHTWVEIVRTDQTIGKELAADYSPEALGGYLAKLYQAVPRNWKRRVSYSRGWPKLPDPAKVTGVTWTPDPSVLNCESEVRQGLLFEVSPNLFRPRLGSGVCECFDPLENPP